MHIEKISPTSGLSKDKKNKKAYLKRKTFANKV
ncbi:hypothetical protein FHS90_000920 [Rufibacter quisquiliarum]|uniref:Uncharacterized protein n=1 Tax=Rufibacter quisquiliarum TaxID=1549639 RepID=A0A839GMN2_9BACT|nr:hypothetical protein [Rufibacter quisquiliarum]